MIETNKCQPGTYGHLVEQWLFIYFIQFFEKIVLLSILKVLVYWNVYFTNYIKNSYYNSNDVLKINTHLKNIIILCVIVYYIYNNTLLLQLYLLDVYCVGLYISQLHKRWVRPVWLTNLLLVMIGYIYRQNYTPLLFELIMKKLI